MNIAIDGPAGAGKSTIARLAAKELGFVYVDTGAMYRAIALYLLDHDTNIEDEAALKSALSQININIVYESGVQHVFLDLQRDIAAKNDVIMDGRDIGTNILPNAELKIYLTASVDVRAKRRFDELVIHGEKPDLEDIKKGIEQRDYQDMNRDIAPLKQAEDAVLIDSSDMSIEEVVDRIVSLAESRK